MGGRKYSLNNRGQNKQKKRNKRKKNTKQKMKLSLAKMCQKMRQGNTSERESGRKAACRGHNASAVMMIIMRGGKWMK